MTRLRETIDEVIDRVAAEMTYVPADPAFAGRIAERLERAPGLFTWHRLAAGAIAVAAVVIVVSLARSSRDEATDIRAATLPATQHDAGALRPPAPPPSARRDTAGTAVASRRTARRITEPRVADAPRLPQIDALVRPAVLDVSELATDPLTVAPVVLAPLDFADLTVAELEGRDDPKE